MSSIFAIALAFAVASAHDHNPHVETKVPHACLLTAACPTRHSERALTSRGCYWRALEQGSGRVLVCPGGVL